jgi:inner membrane protein
MDNLTHSLVGALFGQMGLKKKTGLAMPTLIIAANIPDIDAVATLLSGHQHLAIRRGITHGPPAMVILPLLLWAAMLWFDSWQTRRGTRPEKRLPVHKGWLLALAYVGTLSHPLFDWFNVYGIRLLEPFSSQWFYGDTLFIIDVWIWVALIAGVWFSLRRERREQGNWQRPAWISFSAVCAYIFLNGGITGLAETRGNALFERVYKGKPTMIVASPVPIKFWERELLWRHERKGEHSFQVGSGDYSIMKGARLVQWDINNGRQLFELTELRPQPVPIDSNKYRNVPNAYQEFADSDDINEVKNMAKTNTDLNAYLFWSRMPIIDRQAVDRIDDTLVIQDQRFMDPRVGDRFTVKVKVKR